MTQAIAAPDKMPPAGNRPEPLLKTTARTQFVPIEYGSKSTLTAELKAGSNTDVDFVLAAKPAKGT